MLVFAVRLRAGIMKVGTTVVAVFIGSCDLVGEKFSNRGFHRPFERIDRADDQHRRIVIPTYILQHLAAVFRRQWRKRPSRVSAKFGWDSELAQHGAGLFVTRDDQRILAKTAAHSADWRVHVAGFAAVAN